jgi:hypothetical protein
MSFSTPIRTEPFISANAGTQLTARANAAIWMARNTIVPPWAVMRPLRPGPLTLTTHVAERLKRSTLRPCCGARNGTHLPQTPIRPNVAFGSDSVIERYPRHVRFSFDSDQTTDVTALRVWAKPRHGSNSAPLPLRPPKQTFVNAIGTSVEGQQRPFALQQNSEPIRRRTTVKSVTDLPIGGVIIHR